MHDDGLQTQDELEETPLLIEIDDAVEFDVIPTACENPVLVDQLLSGHGIEHTLQVDVSVIDLEDQSEGNAKENRVIRYAGQAADDKKSQRPEYGHQFVNQQLPPVGTDLHFSINHLYVFMA